MKAQSIIQPVNHALSLSRKDTKNKLKFFGLIFLCVLGDLGDLVRIFFSAKNIGARNFR